VIYTGAATPTEAAAIGFAAALAITGAMGTLTWKGFREAAGSDAADRSRQRHRRANGRRMR